MAGAGLRRAGETARPLVRAVGVLAGLRLLLAPALMLAAVRLLAMPAEAEAVCLLQAGMPTAMLTAIFAQQYGLDHRFGLARRPGHHGPLPGDPAALGARRAGAPLRGPG
jgi:predicted permease